MVDSGREFRSGYQSVTSPSAPVATASKKRKNAAVAAVLSFLIVGLGHFYLGEWRRGAVWLCGGIALMVVLALIFPQLPRALTYVVPLLSGLDARNIAKKKYSA